MSELIPGGAAVVATPSYEGQDWLYPPARWNQTTASAMTPVSHTISGYEISGMTVVVGDPGFIYDTGIYSLRLGGTPLNIDENNSLAINGAAAQANLALLPAGVVLAGHRRIHWWSFRMRLQAPTATFGLLTGIQIIGNQVGTAWFGSDSGLTTGHGIGISGNGVGGLRFHRKVSAGTNANLAETVNLIWPRALTAWTEVWFVILGATATRAATFRLYLDGVLAIERAWGDDGTGGGNPELESGATSFYWIARCAGVTHAAMRMFITDWRYRQGFYNVDGQKLEGT